MKSAKVKTKTNNQGTMKSAKVKITKLLLIIMIIVRLLIIERTRKVVIKVIMIKVILTT